MKLVEYGNTNHDVIMMLHGGGLSWWNYKKEAEMLSDRFHIVLPLIDGHGESDAPFVSIERNAQKLIQYIQDNFGGRIKALCGLSLGAQIAVEMISQKHDLCEYAMIESVSLIPSRFLERMIGPTVSMSYGLIKQRWFSKMQFASLHINASLYREYYRDTCLITKEDMISFLRANTQYKIKNSICNTDAMIKIIVGGKEQGNMIRSAKVLCDELKNGSLDIKEGLYHGEFSLNRPVAYVEALLELIQSR